MPWVTEPERTVFKKPRDLRPGEPFVDWYVNPVFCPWYTGGMETRSLETGEEVWVPRKVWDAHAQRKRDRHEHAAAAGAFGAQQLELFEDEQAEETS